MFFDLNAVETEIAGTRFAGRVRHFASVGSTNTLALEAAQAGAQTGAWVAEEQTAGRGRGGHGWHSVVGDGLYVSVLVTPILPMAQALWISLATGIAAKAAIRDVAGLNADIRWPNDLLIGSRKCGGILVETSVSSAGAPDAAMLRYAVIGVGLNLNHSRFPEEIANMATSLKLAGGREISREALLASLLRHLDAELQRLTRSTNAEGDRPSLLDRFAAASSWVKGKHVRVEESGGYTGITSGLDRLGFLQVDGDDGVRRTVLSGGVREV
jgi:BirA family transcriptional regulator, biotin operon repressor / biotin---[acetyl-CoA-carboxylase] ligase